MLRISMSFLQSQQFITVNIRFQKCGILGIIQVYRSRGRKYLYEIHYWLKRLEVIVNR